MWKNPGFNKSTEIQEARAGYTCNMVTSAKQMQTQSFPRASGLPVDQHLIAHLIITFVLPLI